MPLSPNNCLWVRKLRLEIHTGKSKHGLRGHVELYPWAWIIEELVEVLPSLQDISVALYLKGYVNCWRMSETTWMNRMFRPFCKLADLKTFGIFINDFDMLVSEGWARNGQDGLCSQNICDRRVHIKRDKETFFERRRVGRVWAAEIRVMVLHKEELVSEDSYYKDGCKIQRGARPEER